MKQKAELEKLRGKWNLECITAKRNKVSYILRRSRADYLRVIGSERGLPAYQAEVVESTSGIGTHRDVRLHERERVVELVEDTFESVPEDTVLGKLGVELREEIRAEFATKKSDRQVKAMELEVTDGGVEVDKVYSIDTDWIYAPPREDSPSSPWTDPTNLGTPAFRRRLSGITIAGAVVAGTVLSSGVANATPYEYYPYSEASFTQEEVQSVVANDYTPVPLVRDGIYAPRMMWPVPSGTAMSSGYGWRVAPCAGCSSDHQGIDLNAGTGFPVVASVDGVVTHVGWGGSLGYYVAIDDGIAMKTIYAHLIDGSSPLVEGQKVVRGDFVGGIGCTGACTGAHLHFAVEFDGVLEDPLPYLQKYAVEYAPSVR